MVKVSTAIFGDAQRRREHKTHQTENAIAFSGPSAVTC